jgi:outer membrane protein TolC
MRERPAVAMRTKVITSHLLVLLLAGCASVPRDAGFADVQKSVSSRLDERIAWRQGGEEDRAVDAEVKAMLQQPLSAGTAVQVALLHNRHLQAEYEELGVAQAEVVQAGLLRNPVFGWGRQEGGGITKTTWGIEFDFIGLLLQGPQKRLDNLRFEHAKLRVSHAVLKHATETRKAWYEAVASAQDASFMEKVAELASAEGELAQRQRKAGNLSRRDTLRQQAFAEETRAALARARESAHASRERLNRLMGVWGEDLAWKLPERLPDIPATQPQFDNIEAYGLRHRLDVQMAQKEAQALASGLGLTRSSRFINVFDLGVETEKTTGERRITGPTLRLELPIFDQGQARISRQEAQYRQSEARLYGAAVDARSEMREAWQRATTAYLTAQHARDRLLPLRRQIVEESTLHYNGMLIGVYELLADAREQVAAVQNHIAATRDFWMALADLQLAVGGKLPQALREGAAIHSGEIMKSDPPVPRHEGHAR